MRVRPATPADAGDIVSLKKQLVASSWSDDPGWIDGFPDYHRQLSERLDQLLADPQHTQYWVAEEDGRVVGCLSASVNYYLPGPDWTGVHGHLSDLFVDPDQRGKGIAKALMVPAMDWLRSKDAFGVELHATRMARGMYRAMGFEPRRVESDDEMFVSMFKILRDE